MSKPSLVEKYTLQQSYRIMYHGTYITFQWINKEYTNGCDKTLVQQNLKVRTDIHNLITVNELLISVVKFNCDFIQ